MQRLIGDEKLKIRYAGQFLGQYESTSGTQTLHTLMCAGKRGCSAVRISQLI
jgi:hypothetical protein